MKCCYKTSHNISEVLSFFSWSSWILCRSWQRWYSPPMSEASRLSWERLLGSSGCMYRGWREFCFISFPCRLNGLPSRNDNDFVSSVIYEPNMLWNFVNWQCIIISSYRQYILSYLGFECYWTIVINICGHTSAPSSYRMFQCLQLFYRRLCEHQQRDNHHTWYTSST